MKRIEAGELLKARRALTSATFNDETVTAWHEALASYDYETCRQALYDAARTSQRVTVAHVAALAHKVAPRPPRPRTGDEANHSRSCICAGRGWLETENHDDRHTWTVWTRCPNGPPTAFIEIDA